MSEARERRRNTQSNWSSLGRYSKMVDDLELQMEPVGRSCPKCQKPILAVHGQTPLLLLSCDCHQKFVRRCDTDIIAAWSRAPKRRASCLLTRTLKGRSPSLKGAFSGR